MHNCSIIAAITVTCSTIKPLRQYCVGTVAGLKTGGLLPDVFCEAFSLPDLRWNKKNSLDLER